MAYQQVGTPRFYVSVLQWLDALGKLDISIESNQPGDVITIENLKNIIKLNPTKQEDFLLWMFEWSFKIVPMVGTWDVFGMTYTEGSAWERIMPNEKNFQMTLGHDLGRDSVSSYINRDNIALGGEEEVVNSSHLRDGCDYGGFSIMIGNNAHFPPLNDIRWSFTNYPVQFELPEIPWKIGALAYGTYYDMPNAPNLALTQSYEYAHRNDITTYNGSSISNSFQSKPPMWGDLGAWELSDGSTSNQTLSRTGRRTWNLSFSYMDDGDLWGSNQMLTDYLETSTGLDDDDTTGGLGTELHTNNNAANPGSSDQDDYDGWGLATSNGDLSSVADPSTGGGNYALKVLNNEGTVAECHLYLSINLDKNNYYIITFDAKCNIADQTLRAYTSDSGSNTIPIKEFTLTTSYQTFTIEGAMGDNSNRFQMYVTNQPNASFYTIDRVSIKQVFRENFQYNLLTDDNFFSQVWHKTLGGTLPFVFQPNNNDNTNFAIARLKSNSLKAKRTSPNTYDISVVIEEAW